MAKEAVYGFPCVENPYDFTPDPELPSLQEIEFWEESKKRWDAGERDVRGRRCKTVIGDDDQLVAHITQTSWGIGTNMVEIAEEGEWI